MRKNIIKAQNMIIMNAPAQVIKPEAKIFSFISTIVSLVAPLVTPLLLILLLSEL